MEEHFLNGKRAPSNNKNKKALEEQEIFLIFDKPGNLPVLNPVFKVKAWLHLIAQHCKI